MGARDGGTVSARDARVACATCCARDGDDLPDGETVRVHAWAMPDDKSPTCGDCYRRRFDDAFGGSETTPGGDL